MQAGSIALWFVVLLIVLALLFDFMNGRSEEHTSELQSH